jgi:hypothetical protein
MPPMSILKRLLFPLSLAVLVWLAWHAPKGQSDPGTLTIIERR